MTQIKKQRKQIQVTFVPRCNHYVMLPSIWIGDSNCKLLVQDEHRCWASESMWQYHWEVVNDPCQRQTTWEAMP